MIDCKMILLMVLTFTSYPITGFAADNSVPSEKELVKEQCNKVCEQKQENSYLKQIEKRQNPVSSVGYEPVNPSALPPRNRWSDFLPILGKEAREQGYLLPLPFGISLVGLTQKQPFEVSKIGLAFDGQEDSNLNDFIGEVVEAKNLEVSDSTLNLRLDAWILPFWNVYGLVGRTKGKAELELDFELPIPTPLLIAAGIGNGLNAKRCESVELPYTGPAPGSCLLSSRGIDTTLHFEGTVLGYGTTIAGGYGDFFGMFDMNYTEADINIAIDKSKQTVYSARLGWNGKIGLFQGQIWVGAMKQDIEQTLNLPVPTTDIAVVIDQHVSSPYNYLIGAQWNITEEWAVIAETNFAFSDRQQFMMQLGYRF
ncbi:hypothetical protein [Litorilituus lipolyticus]|uniref:Uncharacterized protein n=1 Tax=Litorilituus lipolyticus TaxID=2491017 RepID=A0A502KKP6_9GAMM|nr:hypothetical protein [Litorilituus lipolyticus]TPH12152.1 hypothetical protein EPA86_17520 [Litorilituus lipolyticus]